MQTTTPPSRERMRVLMLINKLAYGGGAERAMAALAMHLPRDRFDVKVATTRPSGGPLLDALLAAGVPHISFARSHRLDVRQLWRLGGFLRKERIDVLHAHMFGSNLWGTLLGRLTRVPAVIAHEQTWSYEGEALRRFLDGRVIGRLADAFVAVSERDRGRMIELEGVPPEKIVLLPNPYVPRTNEPAFDVRARLGIPGDALVVGTVAVLRPQKALQVLIDAFATLSESLPGAHLAIGGDGPCRADLERRANERGIADRVHFAGWLEDVAGFLGGVDVAAMSSDFEGSPLFALECIAHGTPLVSTDVGNIGEILGDGEGVSIVPRRDPAAMARALEQLLRDPDRRRAQAELARTRLRPYEIDSVVREFAELYERLVRAGERRRSRRRNAWLAALAGSGRLR